jgi:subtilisin family serine protease
LHTSHKTDPRLRGVAALTRVASAREKRKRAVYVFVEVNNAETRLKLKKLSARKGWIREFVHLVEGYCTATVSEDRVGKLAKMPGVVEVESVHYARPLLEQSVASIRGWERIPALGDRHKQGEGVVIGIVDYGLDFALADFRYPADGSTRVAFLWDQQLKPRGKERSPARYAYGVEYTRERINAELSEDEGRVLVRHDPLNLDLDIPGHGTHVAGIAAGNGSSTGTHMGVAPGATLVFVNLHRHAILDQVNSARGSLANSVNLAHAIAYCFEKAEELRQPCVVNLSMGFNGGGHDGNMAVEWIIDAYLKKPGRAVVIAAGNEHAEDKQVHYGDRLKAGASTKIRWNIGRLDRDDPTGAVFALGDPSTNEIEIWYANECRLSVQLISPDENDASPWVDAGKAEELTLQGGEKLIIASDRKTPWRGAARIYLRLSPPSRTDTIRHGTWIIGLRAVKVSESQARRGGVRFDAWIERTVPDPGNEAPELWSRFADYDPGEAITLTTPATARSAITVASCPTSGAVRASPFSSRGPTRDERNKPEIAAPGEEIESSGAGARANNGLPLRTTMQGTSMAAPHVTGVVARLLGRRHDLRAEEIRELLVKSALRSAGPDWDRNRGYGKVDAEAAMKLLERMPSR